MRPTLSAAMCLLTWGSVFTDATHHASNRRAVVRVSMAVESADEFANTHHDKIRCAESGAQLFDGMLTPKELWCNNVDCIDAFGGTFPIHTIDCDADACDVLLHCARNLGAVQYAAGLTLVGAFCLMIFAVYGKKSVSFARVSRISRKFNIDHQPVAKHD